MTSNHQSAFDQTQSPFKQSAAPIRDPRIMIVGMAKDQGTISAMPRTKQTPPTMANVLSFILSRFIRYNQLNIKVMIVIYFDYILQTEIKIIKYQSMGTSSPTQASPKIDKQIRENTSDLDHPNQIPHPRFKNFQYKSGRDGEQNLFVRWQVQSEQIYEKWLNQLKQFNIDINNYLMPLEIKKCAEGACGNSIFVEAFYQSFPHILEQEIRNRAMVQSSKSVFKPKQIWYLVFTLVSAARDFHVKSIRVGDIRPANIFINNSGQLKCTNLLSFPNLKDPYHNYLLAKEPSYLAPEQLRQIQLNKQYPSCNPTLAQAFSVGLTCLDAATLKSSSSLYQKDMSIDKEELSKRVASVKQRYGDDIHKIISGLCKIEPKDRMNCVEVYQMLLPYKQQILELQDFTMEQQSPRSNIEVRNIVQSRTKPVQISDSKYQTDAKTAINTAMKNQVKQSQRNVGERENDKTLLKSKNTNEPYVISRNSRQDVPAKPSPKQDNYGYDKSYKYQMKNVPEEKQKQKQIYSTPMRQTYQFKSKYTSSESPAVYKATPVQDREKLPYKSKFESPSSKTYGDTKDQIVQSKYTYEYGPYFKKYDKYGQKKQFSLQDVDKKIQMSRKTYV